MCSQNLPPLPISAPQSESQLIVGSAVWEDLQPLRMFSILSLLGGCGQDIPLLWASVSLL